jgi:hypothetical protein
MLATMCNEDAVIHHHRNNTVSRAKALFQSKLIFIADERVPIEISDVIERTLPSGLMERYVVTDPGFYARMHGIPGHYQIKYRREGVEGSASGRHTIHLNGPNARVNIRSTDNSSNHVSLAAAAGDDLLSDLRSLRKELVNRAGDNPEGYIAIGKVAEAESAAQLGDDVKANQILSGLGNAARWVLDVAKDVGAKIAAELIAKSSVS